MPRRGLGHVVLGESETLCRGIAASIESLSIVEFQYPSAVGRWFYAPQVRVAANGGVAVTVANLRFTIPGLLSAPSPCGWWRVDAGASLNLFREVYGDYELTIDQQGVRSSGGLATVVMTVRDDNGASATITADGPIVAGSLPTTYTGAPSGPFTICR